MPCGCVLLAYMGLSIFDGPGRTLQVEIESWYNRSWGLHNIDRERCRCEVAISGNGSRMNRCEHKYSRYYLFPDGHGAYRSLYLRPGNEAFSIDDATRTFRGGPCSCTWQTMSALPDDHNCTKTAQERLPEGRLIGRGRVAGHEVVRYLALDEGYETQLSLAPGLACEVMEEVVTHGGTLGIPGGRWRYRVAAYKAGEPHPSVFKLPAGYILEQQRE